MHLLVNKSVHVDISTSNLKEYMVRHKTEIKVLAIYLLISLVMFWQVTINFFGYVVNGHGDVYQSLFNLWWVPYAIFTLHISPYFTNLLFYPVGANLVTQTLTPLAGIITAPLQSLLGGAFAYNTLFFSSFALSGLFMFMLANYFIKNKYAAFIAGLIYAFSPMHVAQSYGHLDWTIIEWIPLFLYFYVKTIDLHKWKYAFLAAVSFVLVTFMGEIEQGIMVVCATAIFTALYWLFYTPEHGRHPAVSKGVLEKVPFLSMSSVSMKSVVGILLFILFALILSSPFIIGILPHLSNSTFATAQQNSGLAQNMLWSDNLASYFLPSYYNGIFNGISQSYVQSIYGLTYQGAVYQIDIGERVSYIGYSVLLLALLAIYYDFKQNRLKHTFIWVVFLLIFGSLSLGPYLQVYSTVTNIPTLYSIYRNIPVFNIIREPARFDLIVTICLGILAALGFEQITKGKDRKTVLTYLAVVTAIILIEYNGTPLSGAFASSLITTTQIPSAYSEIGNLQGNFSVLMIPALANTSDTPAQYIGMETYYVTALKKPILGGYTSRQNETQSLTVGIIPLVAASTYLESGYGFIYPSPIIENYSNVTLLFLANYNTGFVALLRQAYNLTDQELLYEYLNSSFGPPVYESNSTLVFSTGQAITKYAGKSIVAYTIGSWIPGYSLCTGYESCNQNTSELWWGNNTRSLILYSPATQTIKMSLVAGTPVSNTTVSIFINGNLDQQMDVRGPLAKYVLNITVPQGLNELSFYTPNSSQQLSPLFAYGLENITFTK